MPAGEFEFIDWIRSRTPSDPRVIVPIGDDLAALKWEASDGLLLVGIDQVLDGVHFDSSVHSPRQIGRKAMNRNLSDCAAMACLPTAAVVSAALPRGASLDYAKEIYEGLREAGDAFGCSIVGGDTGSWDGKLALTVAIFGRSDGVPPVTRGGASVGDRIYVTGALGGSWLGRHMTFEPRVKLSRALAMRDNVAAMIDLSDGLSRDLGHICRASRVGAVIDASLIPIHDDAMLAFRQDRIEPLMHALNDGEDYELLFTCRTQASLGICIGEIVAEPGIRLKTSRGMTPLEPKGWEHTL